MILMSDHSEEYLSSSEDLDVNVTTTEHHFRGGTI